MRLSCYSNSKDLTLMATTGSVGGRAPGAYPEVSVGGSNCSRFLDQDRSVIHVSASPVDSAGWTEVVIQKGRGALSNSIAGRSAAEVNASVNRVSGFVLAEFGSPRRKVVSPGVVLASALIRPIWIASELVVQTTKR